ncbi:hypothetical protein BI291_13610 [Thalassotalea sp. PP2-459]|nr:hypothetical protein BI291_13610 [Thalassotalea sp. PP2-459]
MSFLGQAMASTVMSYHMINMKTSQSQTHNMDMMDHSHHQMATQSAEHHENMDEDCCLKICNCLSGSCSNAVLILLSETDTHKLDFSTKIHRLENLVQSHTAASLYKPPIFA